MSEKQYPPVPKKLVPSGGAAGGSSITPPEPQYPPTPSLGGAEPSAATPVPPVGPGFNRQEFIKSYANMVAQTWLDDTYLELILANPVDTLAKAGMPTADGATIRIVQCKITGMGQVQDQVDAWIEGNHTGLYDLWLPIKPDDVEVSPGGGAPDACAGGASCCCTPCCCCT